MFKNGVVRFDETVRVELQQDAHLIVVAVGEHADLSKGWGKNPQGAMHPPPTRTPSTWMSTTTGFGPTATRWGTRCS